ncbi:MAG: type II secretion system F family protein, partial [Burkholderiales bacterium]|nr:type II secretion system F family protein [Burkholderiales bacterium]
MLILEISQKITIDAQDEQDARRQVEARGLFAASVTASRGDFLSRKLGNTRGKLSIVLFSQELLALLSAGLSIVEALEALLEKEANPYARHVFDRLLAGLREGKRFSQVLADQAELFPPLYIGIMKAAEGTSDLPRALGRFIDYQQRIDAVRAKLVSAAIYPAILMLVGGGVSGFLITYVVPRFAEVYKGAGRNLPWMSQLLLEWGQFSSQHTQTLLMIVASVIVVGGFAIKQFLASGALSRTLARLPAIGERIRIYQLSRLYLTLGMLLEGGIPIVSALHTVQDMVPANIKAQL